MTEKSVRGLRLLQRCGGAESWHVHVDLPGGLNSGVSAFVTGIQRTEGLPMASFINEMTLAGAATLVAAAVERSPSEAVYLRDDARGVGQPVGITTSPV